MLALVLQFQDLILNLDQSEQQQQLFMQMVKQSLLVSSLQITSLYLVSSQQQVHMTWTVHQVELLLAL